MIQDDDFDLIVGELDRCWEVTQHQDKASKIEKTPFETQRDVKTENTWRGEKTTTGKCVGHTHCRQWSRVTQHKLTECTYDKVVMWTGGSYDDDDVARAGTVGSP